jgi:hypothetical protein
MMRLWGVRYVITNTDTKVGQQTTELPISESEDLRLIELPNANLGNYSPTEIKHVDDFRSGLVLMHEQDFDGEHKVITDSALDGFFVPATDVSLIYEKYGFHLQAESTGRSLLVLPVQYSHCWTSEGLGAPTLFRADMMQLGVNFTGKLDAKLVFRYGPLFRFKLPP